MNEIKTKWLGGTTAKDYIAGSVELITGTKDKPCLLYTSPSPRDLH